MGGLAGVGARTALLGTQEVIETLVRPLIIPKKRPKNGWRNIEDVYGAYVHPKAGDAAVAKPAQPKSSTGGGASTDRASAQSFGQVVPEEAKSENPESGIPNPEAKITNPQGVKGLWGSFFPQKKRGGGGGEF